MRVVAIVDPPKVMEKVFRHLNLWCGPATFAPARIVLRPGRSNRLPTESRRRRNRVNPSILKATSLPVRIRARAGLRERDHGPKPLDGTDGIDAPPNNKAGRYPGVPEATSRR